MKNVLLILTDDQRYDALRAAGNNAIHTPNLDRLAASGAMFTHAHIPCGTHGAVCMPSRAMLHTGRTLFSLEGCGENIPASHTTLAEAFKSADYETYGAGKWHNGPPSFARGFTAGDNIFFGGMWDHWNVPVNRYDPTGAYDNVINFTANFFNDNKTVKVRCDKFNPGVHSSELLTDTGINFIKNRSAEKPFFLYLAYLAPHDPRTMPEKFKAMYDPEKIALPANFMKRHPFTFGVEDIRDELLAASPRDEAEARKHLAEYYAMVTHLDFEIGRLLDELERQNLLGETIIVVAGDNGLAVGSHGLMGKQNLYDHSVRVPLIMSGPGIPKNRAIANPVYLLDIFPTLCDLCGLPVPGSVEGKSFARMFHDPNFTTRNALYFAYTGLIRGVKDGRYKLIEYRNHANRQQLFDLLEDPCETRDLAADPAHSETLSRMAALLHEQRAEWNDFEHPLSKRFWN